MSEIKNDIDHLKALDLLNKYYEDTDEFSEEIKKLEILIENYETSRYNGIWNKL